MTQRTSWQLLRTVLEQSSIADKLAFQPEEQKLPEVIALVQTHGTESNDNTDIVAVGAPSELTTEGDRV